MRPRSKRLTNLVNSLLDHFGHEVQLSNVRLEELLRVEIYRRGPRSNAFNKPKLGLPRVARYVQKTVVIDSFPESISRYRDGYAIVAVDVVRATTTAITAAASGRRCFPVATVTAALELAASLENVLLAGEEQGIMPPGFDLNNSPTELLARGDFERPVVLVSSSGTKLCHEASKCDTAFLACLRNYKSIARHLAQNFPKVAVIGAGTRGEFREEDQMCCAWIAELLLVADYRPMNRETVDFIKRWSNKPVSAWIGNKSTAYLRRTDQLADLKFILEHVADLDSLFFLNQGEVIMCEEQRQAHRRGVFPQASRLS